MKKVLLATLLPVTLENEAKSILEKLDQINSDLKIFVLDTFVSHLKRPDRILEEHDRLKNESQEKLSLSINLMKKMTKNGKYKIDFEPASCMGSPEFVIPDIIKNYSIDFFLVSQAYLKKTKIKDGKLETFLKNIQISSSSLILF